MIPPRPAAPLRPRKSVLTLGLAAAAIAVAAPAGAQTPILVPKARNAAATPAPNTFTVPAGARTQRFTIPVGKSVIVNLPEDASEVFVGRPEVANAVVRTARRLYLMAMSKGPTTIFALDHDGRQIATLEINVIDRDIGALEGILKTVMPDNDIRVQAVDDSVILTGTVASAVDAQRALDIATAYTGYTALGTGSAAGGGVSVSAGTPVVVPGRIINSLVIRGQDQVTLKVSIVEIRRDVAKQFGINLNGAWGNAAAASSLSPAGSAAAAATNLIGGTTTASSPLASLNFAGQKNSFEALVRSFESNGVAHIMAEPNVTAISGETAKFQAGGTIPIPSSSTINPLTNSCIVTYTQQQYGVILNFTPTVLSGGRISLHVATEVIEPDNASQIVTTCATYVGFRDRRNETTVELPSGGSIVSAGLVQQQGAQTISGTPGLIDLPILGALFRSRSYQRDETELMIVVTPYIAKTLRPDQISKPDDGFTDSTDPQAWLLGRINRIYSSAASPELVRGYRGRAGFIND